MKLKTLIKENCLEILAVRDKRKRASHWVDVAKKNSSNPTALTDDMKQQLLKYYEPLFETSQVKIPYSLAWNNFYYEKTGNFDVRYIPDDLYYTYIDPYYNDWKAAMYLDNKCLYEQLFRGYRLPENVACRIDGTWVRNDQLVELEQVLRDCALAEEVVIKQAEDSEGGHGVFFCRGNDSEVIADRLSKIEKDVVIQKPIHQHETLNKLNFTSVNTVRILTLLRNCEVTMLSSILRMGIDGSRVDNASRGGITCGIDAEGRLKKYAYKANGERFTKHPTSGIIFEGVEIHNFNSVISMVKQLAVGLPMFRLVSWDIAIGRDGEPMLLETNLHYGELDFHQLNNGPIFANETEVILGDVFGKTPIV